VPRSLALLAGIFVLAALGGATSARAQYEESPSDTYRPPPEEWKVPLQGRFESSFGYRWGRLHAGIDISVLRNDRVRAAYPGIVSTTGWLPRYAGYGLVVKIRHGDGLSTLYAHLPQALVRPAQKVEPGQLIGRAGCTGSCTGQHLHFETHVRGRPVNPLRFLGDAVRPLD
jgi:murein DD-endopeptidase MepM/ murein hydrolase activator NlpD